VVAYFETFLDAGGDLFLSGQDIGWDVWTPAGQYGNATPASQDFYTNYLNSSWIADGDNTNSQLTPVLSDPIFNVVPNMTIIHHYGSYFYPDQIAAVGIGIPIFNYNSNASKVAGIRVDNGTYKIVYVAPGMEMFTLASATSILTRTYDWFHGIISGVNEIENGTLGNSYPNPADDYAMIPVSGIKSDAKFLLYNSLGQLVMKENLSQGTSEIQISTSGLPQGIYHYQISNQKNQPSQSLIIAH
ncbi:MAG: T9SS type A sorting domain-containing protein, partial [Chitinophagales bacterium]